MNAERWQEINRIFDAAVEIPAEERPAFLRVICGDDESLRRDVEAMLAADADAQSFLEESPLRDSTTEAPTMIGGGESARRTLDVGQTVGRYRLVREVGRGGMGAVYLAERADGAFSQQVAIKVIQHGTPTEFILNRFRRERQILANLRHPNIVRLLDGGATEGDAPYLVMEYVEGQPIDIYCVTRDLSLRDRLELFRKVCAAVQFAHQNLVVHRDLKPSNILVTEDGTPKLLDFGIAKLLDPENPTSKTELTAMRAMTPEYASPEQISGEAITTASDVYSLAVVLYLLLTGRRPYKLKTGRLEELLLAITQGEAAPPSAIVDAARAKALRGDLDTILMTALRKEPQRRYASVEQFSEDLRRYLAGLPIQAQTDTFIYRTGKFIRRNKIGATAGALLALSILVGTGATAWQARVARAERIRAEKRFNDVRKLARSVMFDYQDAIASLPGAMPARKRLVTDALEYLDNLARESESDADLQLELAEAYVKVGDIQGKPYRFNLGDTKGALASYRKARNLCEALSKTRGTDARVRKVLGMALEAEASLLVRQNQLMEAVSRLNRATELYDELAREKPGEFEYRRLAAGVRLSLGDAVVYSDPGTTRSLDFHRRAGEMLEALHIATPTDDEVTRQLAQVYQRIGNLIRYAPNQDLPQSLEYHRRSLALRETLAATHPESAQARRDVADELLMRSYALRQAADFVSAQADCERAVTMFESLSGADPTNMELRHDLAFAHSALAGAQEDRNNIAAATQARRRSVAILEKLVSADPSNFENVKDLKGGRLGLARILGDTPESLDILRRIYPPEASDLSEINGYQELARKLESFAGKAAGEERTRLWREARAAFARILAVSETEKSSRTFDEIRKDAASGLVRCDAALDP